MVLTIFLFISRLAGAQLIYETVWVDYDSAWEYGSLQVIPIRARDPGAGFGASTISLSNAIREGIATISERGSASTENVHWLRLNNSSDKTIFVASGQTFSGGRQDRMVTKDTMLAPTGKDQYIPVMCIEEGRWSDKERKLIYGSYANMRLRRVLDKNKNQVLVWKEILSQLDSAKLNSPTFSYNALQLNKTFQINETSYLHYFREKFKNTDSSICGVVCVSGNKVLGCDVFAGAAMFYDEFDPLMTGYIGEALMYGSAPMLAREDIKLYVDQILTNETKQQEYCKKNGKIFRPGNKVIHVTSY